MFSLPSWSLSVGLLLASGVNGTPTVTTGPEIAWHDMSSWAVEGKGWAYPSILGRMLDWPIVNLGFSGKTEPEMAQLVAEIRAAAYVVDSLPNLEVTQIKERIDPLVMTLRQARPQTPILLVENESYADAGFIEARRVKVSAANAYLRQLYSRLKTGGDKHIHYVPASFLLGGDGEDTVDGTHPTDLGSFRMAQGIEPILREALAGACETVPVEEGFAPLFDGQSLSGWKKHQGLPPQHPGGKWWVEDCELRGTQDPPGKGGLLWLEGPFTNFILKLQVVLTYPMDSGIFLRVGPAGRSHQVCLDYRPGSDVGAIFIAIAKRGYVYRNEEGARLVRPDTWNNIEVRIAGEPARIRVWMNEHLLTDFQHTTDTTEGVPEHGGIALQIHPNVAGLTIWKPGAVVRFRNIRLKPLP